MGNASCGDTDGCFVQPASPAGIGAVGSRAGSKVQVAATEIVKLAGIAAYHTSLILGSREYYFGHEGLCTAPALWSHQRPPEQEAATPTKVMPIGASPYGGMALLQALRPFFLKGSYDVLHKNCNSFTDAALFFLTGQRLDGRYNRLERLLLAAEPLSTSVIDRLMRAFSSDSGSPGNGYQVNPLAQGFSVDAIIELWTADDEAGIAAATRPRAETDEGTEEVADFSTGSSFPGCSLDVCGMPQCHCAEPLVQDVKDRCCCGTSADAELLPDLFEHEELPPWATPRQNVRRSNSEIAHT